MAKFLRGGFSHKKTNGERYFHDAPFGKFGYTRDFVYLNVGVK